MSGYQALAAVSWLQSAARVDLGQVGGRLQGAFDFLAPQVLRQVRGT